MISETASLASENHHLFNPPPYQYASFLGSLGMTRVSPSAASASARREGMLMIYLNQITFERFGHKLTSMFALEMLMKKQTFYE